MSNNSKANISINDKSFEIGKGQQLTTYRTKKTD